MVNVTVIAALELVLLTTFIISAFDGGESLLNPPTYGVNVTVPAVVVIDSVITPDPGTGSTVIGRAASDTCAALLSYSVIHAPVEVWME